ncbi:class II fructose-bisphosphate aldolase [Candidatus Nomurabacteria bacterium]|nr:class II fructose-bisphosphate aldolase [Candidatus Kaiserbacteria bacterium]MCB9815065.1 class II fructose-bisphosphate aldolase [Candidatus Nomurabacteria bacterium]
MKTLREVIVEAEKNKVAVGHFNVSDSSQLWGIFNAARSLNLPVVIGASEGERDFIGPRQLVAMVHSLRDEFQYPIYTNADHTYSFERVKEAIDVGFDAVIFDGNKVSHEENLVITKQCVEYAHAQDHEVLVEAELGNIGMSSKLLDGIPEGAEITDDMLTVPEELAEFVSKTGVDLIAPAVGNLHGMMKHGNNPRLNIGRIAELRQAGGVPMVLHGGSGITDEDFSAAIEAGIGLIHINTEIRKAYRDGIAKYLTENPDEISPYRYLKAGRDDLQAVVEGRLKLFADIK